MRFTRIILDNWRNFGHVDVTLENRAFLVGPNASGKSNFLDAFRFLRDLVLPGGGFISAVNTRGGIVRLRNLAARRYRSEEHTSELQSPTKIVCRILLEKKKTAEYDVQVCWVRAVFADNGSQRRGR